MIATTSSQMISLNQIRLDERCQPRTNINPEVIDEYASAMESGAEFPPLTVYRDGGDFYLADGFHRHAAAVQAGKAHFHCEVQPGSIRDAILHAVGANSSHGMRRTNDDKRRAVLTLLHDAEWAQWSDREISRRCAVDNSFVSRLRHSLLTNNSEVPQERTYTDRYGNQRTMNTANIGTATPRHREFVDNDSTWSPQLTNEVKGYGGDYARPPVDEDGVIEHLGPSEPKQPFVSHNSGENEWYTPSEYLEAAREVLGTIDLDPASSDVANERVKATSYFTKEDNGLAHEWHGNVWLNPPYAQPLISEFCEKVVEEFEANRVKAAIVLVNNATETRFFRRMAESAPAICFPTGRIKYLDSAGRPANTPLQGQAFLYFGDDTYEFISTFRQYGFVVEVA